MLPQSKVVRPQAFLLDSCIALIMSHAVSSCIFTLLFQLNANILSVESDVALCATADTLCRVTIGRILPRNSPKFEKTRATKQDDLFERRIFNENIVNSSNIFLEVNVYISILIAKACFSFQPQSACCAGGSTCA